MRTYLAIERLSVAYGRTLLLDGLDPAVAEGEVVALLGASGCGKTTLLRAVCGFAPVRSGRIVVDGRPIQDLPPERRDTALVFQSYALWPHPSAARVGALPTLPGLDGLGERDGIRLSGGQRRRLALGRALAIEPRLLLLEEPLSDLDPRIRQERRHEIRSLRRRLGITALHVTHDREEAMVMADRIAVMDRGRIVRLDTPEGRWHRPANAFVAAFMGVDNRVELEVEAQDGALRVRGRDVAPASLPPGPAGPHLAGRPRARMLAHFRSAAARLLDPETAPPGTLLLRGTVERTSGRSPVSRRRSKFAVPTFSRPRGLSGPPRCSAGPGPRRSAAGRGPPAIRASSRRGAGSIGSMQAPSFLDRRGVLVTFASKPTRSSPRR